jgi:hypothetical protein
MDLKARKPSSGWPEAMNNSHTSRPLNWLARVRDLGLTFLAVVHIEPAQRRLGVSHVIVSPRKVGKSMSKAERKPFWFAAPELPEAVCAAWRKAHGAISPVAIVATVDADGTPRTAPFGSLQAVSPRLLRLCSWKGHDSYANLCRDGRVSVALVSPDVAVSVRGRARVVKERMDHDPEFAALEIDVEEVKNDMAYRIVIDSAIVISAKDKYKPWYDEVMAELENVGLG